MNDRELITLAAKAADIQGNWELDTNFVSERWYFNVPYDKHGLLSGFEWNPLREDSDALRLAIKLHLDINSYPATEEVAAVQHRHNGICYGITNRCFERIGKQDIYAATRKAIVRAAAEIGKNM